MPHRSPWPRKSDHALASFPAEEKIPQPARPALDAFLNMRVRLADAEDAIQQANRSLTEANDSESRGLLEHLRQGGTADTFERPSTEAARTTLAHAKQEHAALKVLIGETYMDAMKALQGAAPAGAATAQADITTAHRAYVTAIETAEQARRAYLQAVGLRYFWAHLTEYGEAMAGAGQADVIAFRDGPITRVDDGTFALLRSDAKAHTRIDGTSPAANAW